VVGFLYWLCAWADPRYKQVSEELHLAGVTMLQSLMCEIGGAKIDSFTQVEFVKHYGSEWEEVCFLRVNGTHALLLSDTQAPDDGRDGKRAGYWGDSGLTLVAVCCEELPVSWQRVETETFTLTSWEPDAGIHYLSLAELKAFPVFQTPIHHGIHAFVDEFHRALVGVVDAEQQFREIPPEQWNQHAWRGFYKLVATSFGGKLFLKPLGAMKRPLCRINWERSAMELCFEDAKLSVVLNGPLPPLEMLFHLRMILEQESASALGFSPSLNGYEVKEITCLIEELPEHYYQQVKVPLLRNFLLLDKTGLVDVTATINRLIVAREFLTNESQCSRPFATVTEELMLWLDDSTPLDHTTRSAISAPLDRSTPIGSDCQYLVARLIDYALQEIPVISTQERRVIQEVLEIHMEGMRKRHFNQFYPNSHEEGALIETGESHQ
jgi:hypothetical protein